MVEANPDGYCQNREQGDGMGHKCPFDAPLDGIGGVNQCGHTLEEHSDNNPYKGGSNKHGEHRQAGV